MNDQPPADRRPLIREAYPERHPASRPVADLEPPEPGANNHLEILGASDARFSGAVLLCASLARDACGDEADGDGKNEDCGAP